MQRYAIGLGSNRRHGRYGPPARVVLAAIRTLEKAGVRPIAVSPIIATAPMGPAGRSFANAAAIVASEKMPGALLALLKQVERDFGRRRGRRWGARVLDLDILLWSGGSYRAAGLAIPHAGLPDRRFVLDPLVTIAPRWPAAGVLRVRHLHARLTRRLPTRSAGSGRVRSSVGRASDF